MQLFSDSLSGYLLHESRLNFRLFYRFVNIWLHFKVESRFKAKASQNSKRIVFKCFIWVYLSMISYLMGFLKHHFEGLQFLGLSSLKLTPSLNCRTCCLWWNLFVAHLAAVSLFSTVKSMLRFMGFAIQNCIIQSVSSQNRPNGYRFWQ